MVQNGQRETQLLLDLPDESSSCRRIDPKKWELIPHVRGSAERSF